MSAPQSRWYQMFAAALEERPAVGVQVAVSDHLGRVPDHSEANAARRAAHSFAAAGHARLERVAITEGGQRDRLVLTRVGIEPTPELLAAALVATGTSFVSQTPGAMHTAAAQRLVCRVKELAAQSRHIRADEVDTVEGAALVAALGGALNDLARFRRQLGRPARRLAKKANRPP